MRLAPEALQDGIINRLSRLTGVPRDDIDADTPLVQFGVDSMVVMALAAEIEQWLGYRFRDNPLQDHPTVASLAQFLEEQTGP